MQSNPSFFLIGCNHVGANLAKELARFLHSSGLNQSPLNLIDNGLVTEDSLRYLPLRREDIGSSLSGSLSNALKDCFDNLFIESYHCDITQHAHCLSSAGMVYLINMTKCDIRSLLPFVSNGILLDAGNCLDGHGSISITMKCHDVCSDSPKINVPVPDVPCTRLLSGTWISGILFNLITGSICQKKIRTNYVSVNALGFYSKMSASCSEQATHPHMSRHDGRVTVACVGAGGTGGVFLKEFARFLSGFDKIPIDLAIIDGDRVEERNLERQPFTSPDLMQYKAAVLADAMLTQYNIGIHTVKAVCNYIDTAEDLNAFIGDAEDVYLVGCVDNHPARRAMELYFQNKKNAVYIDSGNEYWVGEVVIGIRKNNITLAKSRAHYYPEVWTDDGLAASSKTCEEENASSPQHQATNLYAGHILLNVLIQDFSLGRLNGGIIYFDAFQCFSRFDVRWCADEHR